MSRLIELTVVLAGREVRAQYRRSFLGPAWAIFLPLSYLTVFLLLQRVLALGSDELPYALYAMCALVPWTFLSSALARCGPSVQANAGLLKKAPVPRLAFPMAGVTVALLDFGIAFVLLLALMVWHRYPVGWPLLWLPVLVALVAALALGLGIALAALGTYRRDILLAQAFFLQLWLLATPVVYPLSRVPRGWRPLYDLNPMVGLVEGFRSVLIRNQPPDLQLLAMSAGVTALVWLVTWPLFRVLSQYFADAL